MRSRLSHVLSAKVPLGTEISVPEPIIVAGRFDIRGLVWKAAGSNDKVFDIRPGGHLVDSYYDAGTGWIDGNSQAAAAFVMDDDCLESIVQYVRWRYCAESILMGGSRLLQTGGRCKVLDCYAYQSKRLSMCGMAPEVHRTTFEESPDIALFLGRGALEWDDPNGMFASNPKADDLTFLRCGTDYTPGTDGGIFGASRDWTVGTAIFNRWLFKECHGGRCYYIDDTSRRFWINGLYGENNLGMLYSISGGREIHIDDCISKGDQVTSIWDDRGNYTSPVLGGAGHSMLPIHAGRSWTHGGYSYVGTTAPDIDGNYKIKSVDDLVRAPGAEAWLAALDALDYSTDCALDTTFTTTGTFNGIVMNGGKALPTLPATVTVEEAPLPP